MFLSTRPYLFAEAASADDAQDKATATHQELARKRFDFAEALQKALFFFDAQLQGICRPVFA
jgi:hypothetical protein